MNHVYRVVFNHSLGVYQCVSELAKSRGKSSGKSQVATKLLLTPLAIAVLCASGSALAVTYDNGQTTTINDNPYVISEDVIITGTGTEVETNFPTVVGKDANKKLTVTNGGALDTFVLNIGQNEGSNGEVLIEGKSPLYLENALYVGDAGKGLFTLQHDDPNEEQGNGNNLLIYTDSYIGNRSTGEGTLVIDGSGADLNTRGNLYVGNEGTGNFIVKNVGAVNIGEALIVGSKAGSKNNVVELSSSDRSGSMSFISAGSVILGDAGEGALNIFKLGSVSSTSSFIVANQTGSSASMNLDNGSVSSDTDFIMANGDNTVANTILSGDSYLRSDNNLIVANGINSNSEINLKNDSSIFVENDIIIGNKANSTGLINVERSRLNSKNMILGQQGSGALTVNDDPYTVGNVSVSDTTYVGGFGTNSQGAKGFLTIDNAAFKTGKLIVGNTGSGTLNLINGGVISTDSIERNTASILSNIFIDGGEFRIKKDQSNLFANFTKNDLIEVSEKGISFETTGNNNGEIGTYVVINPNAVITGNAGKLNVGDESGGFAKYGLGTLEISESSKQWTGDLTITQGTLKFNGNYIMGDDETLTIGLLDWDEDGTIDENYGKFLIDGAVDISKGNLFVYADEVIANVAKDSEWKDVIKATIRVGEFTEVNDNSPLVSFYADYSDANAVHLKMGTPPVVTPEPPVVTPEPPVVTPEPPVVTPEPPVVTPEPPVVTPEPPVVTPEPPVVTPEPPVVTPEPPVVTPEPPIADTTFVDSVNGQSQRNDLGIAYALDNAIQDQLVNGDNDLAKALISSTTNFNQSQLAGAANELQPLFMGATNRIIADTNYAASEAITEHRATTTERNVWAKLIGNKGSHDAEDGVTGYEADSYGAIVGLDTPINSDLNLGLAVSYIDTDADTDGSRLDHKLTAKNWQVLGYGNYGASDATDVNFHIGAGRSSVKGERHLSILTNAVARSDYDVDTLRAGLGVDHRIGSEQRHVTPFAKVNYAQAKSDSYRETGAGVYNLNVDENRYESMRWTAGLKMSQYLTPQFAITGQLAAAIENGDQHSDITANFVGMPNDSFTTIGQEVGREIGIVGIGISYMPTLKTTLSAGYRSEWRENYDDQGASIALQTTF